MRKNKRWCIDIDKKLKQNQISVRLKSDTDVIPKDKMVTAYSAPHFLQIIDVKKQSNIPYRKLDNQLFVNIETGEIKQISKSPENVRSIPSLRKTFSRISLLIKSNFYGGKSECFISLSYNKRISDNNELNRDIKNFYAKLSRNSNVPYRCLVVLEYQGNGNVHIHVLTRRLDNECLRINELEKRSLWDHGIIHIQRLYDSEGLADYLNPFKISHKRKRLRYYKQNMQIYRCYGHFDRPKKSRMSYETAVKLAKTSSLIEYKNESFVVLGRDNLEVNKIQKINYKEINNYG